MRVRTPRSLFRTHGILAILLLGAALRFYGLDWARGYYFQPDESVHTIDYLMRLPSSLNPYETGPYTYGGLPLYLYLFSARGLSWLFRDPTWLDKWHVTLIARGYSAVASTLIIALLYRLSRFIGLERAAWVPAFAFAVSPLAIQYAHYGVVDTLLTFWVVLFSTAVALCWKRGTRWGWITPGLFDPEFYLGALQGKEYIVIMSRRNYGAMYHLHGLFPVAASFYRSVFDGCLGYSIAARFTNYPRIGPWIWNTDQAEETFQVFDHPVVYIFKRSAALDQETLRRNWELCLSR